MFCLMHDELRLQEIRFAPLSNLRFLSALHYAFEGMAQIELGGRRFACPTEGLDSQSAAFLTQLLPGAATLLSPSRLQQLVSGQQGCAVDSSAVAGERGCASCCLMFTCHDSRCYNSRDCYFCAVSVLQGCWRQ
jgi:hypothetical protein